MRTYNIYHGVVNPHFEVLPNSFVKKFSQSIKQRRMNKKQQLELENEQEAAEDAAFMVELTQYVATLPKPSPEAVHRYNDKLAMLESIHAEIEAVAPKQPGDDWEPDNSLDDRYLHQYRVSTN